MYRTANGCTVDARMSMDAPYFQCISVDAPYFQWLSVDAPIPTDNGCQWIYRTANGCQLMYRTANGCQCRVYLIVNECAIHYFQWTHRLVPQMDCLSGCLVLSMDVPFCQ